MTAFARNDFPAMVKDVPPITIQGGHVTSTVAQPSLIKDPQGGKNFAVIDTTGKINSMDDTDAQILITDHKIWSRQNRGDIRQFDVSQIKYFYLDKAKLIGWMDGLRQWLAILSLPILMIFSLIFRLIQAIIYGGLNMAFSSGFRANLTYAAAMRLAVVSVTPVIFVDTFLWLGRVHIPLRFLLGIGVSLLYMVILVKANADPDPQAPGGLPVTLPPRGYVP